MGTLVRYERSWSPPRGVSCTRCPQAWRRPDTYIPIPATGRTVPYHRSFIKLFCFLFLIGLDRGSLKGKIGAIVGLSERPHNRGLLLSSQGFFCPAAVGSSPSPPRENGLKRPSNILRVLPALAVVQFASLHHVFPAFSENCVVNFRMIFCLQDQLCKGDTQ